MKIKKQQVSPDEKYDHMLTGESDELEKTTKLSVVKKEYAIACKVLPDYNALTKEILEYTVDCPAKFDVADFSEVNELYAIAQSYYSRVSTVLMLALDNFSRWKRIHRLMQDYVADLESEAILEEDIRGMKNKMQEAVLRKRFKKQYQTLATFEFKFSEAEGFKRTIETKKEDLSSVLTTLSKQVKALSVERSLTFTPGRK